MPKYIITAAHCFDENKHPSSYQVRAGSSFREHFGSIHQVRYITIHENYEENDLNAFSDLAILELENPIELNNRTKKSIETFKLGEPSTNGSVAVTAGWGRATEDGLLPDQLTSIEMSIVDRKSCNDSWRFGGIFEIQQGQICAASANGSQSICSGDSGGPLVVGGKLAGVTSTSSDGCKSRPLPNVFTEVAYFNEWIDEIVIGRSASNTTVPGEKESMKVFYYYFFTFCAVIVFVAIVAFTLFCFIYSSDDGEYSAVPTANPDSLPLTVTVVSDSNSSDELAINTT